MSDHKSDHKNESVLPFELQQMLAEKRQDLKNASSFDYLAGMTKAGIGAVTGLFLGAATMAGVVVKRTYDFTVARFPDVAKRGMSDAQMESQIAEELIQVLEKEQSLAGTLVRNPNTFMLGAGLAGGAVGLALQFRKQRKDRQDAEQDITKLERLSCSWAERIQSEKKTEGEAKKSPFCTLSGG